MANEKLTSVLHVRPWHFVLQNLDCILRDVVWKDVQNQFAIATTQTGEFLLPRLFKVCCIVNSDVIVRCHPAILSVCLTQKNSINIVSEFANGAFRRHDGTPTNRNNGVIESAGSDWNFEASRL